MDSNRRLMLLIALALIAWGLFLAIGAYLNYGNYDPWRFVVVLGCVLGFLAFWGVMLRSRRRRLNRRGKRDDAAAG